MSDYDFRKLHDKDFEVIVVELLALREGVFIERFKPGKDMGIDGRFYKNGTTIIQSKHYVNSGFSALLSKLKIELAKIKKINPDRYIVATSLPLSPDDKNKIIDILQPYVLSTIDVCGAEDLNTLLTNYPQVERKHFKLWLSGMTVLNSILNSALLGRSDFTLSDAYDSSQKYVKTAQFDKAIELINFHNIIVITGLPGVGKTTLANQLAFFFVSQGYEFYHIASDVTEAERIFSDSESQFFYFDDFLGANYVELINGNTSSHIVSFMKRVIKSKNKKFVLTSRTNILNRVKSLSETLSINNLEKKEFEVNVSSLSMKEKGEILYSHIWHSTLNVDFVDEIYRDKRYWSIIKHKNFNPRIIEFITSNERIGDIPAKNYWSNIISILNNPEGIWSFYFNKQMSMELLFIWLLLMGGILTKMI